MAAYQALGKIRTVTGAVVEFQQEDDGKTLGKENIAVTFHMPLQRLGANSH